MPQQLERPKRTAAPRLLKSISFSVPMLRAIRAGEKTQTRRLIKPQPGILHMEYVGSPPRVSTHFAVWADVTARKEFVSCPYGEPGHVLKIREPIYRGIEGYARYAADDQLVIVDGHHIPWKWKLSRLGAMYMPQEFVRDSIKVVDIRAEHLHLIDDAQAEMLEGANYIVGDGSPRERFEKLWRELNGPKSWDENPYVWVVNFWLVLRKAVAS